MNIDLSIIVPCYNEERNIEEIFKRFKEVIRETNAEVILVQNGSTDLTKSKIEEITIIDNRFKMVNIDRNEGYGNGILRGLEFASGNILAWTHADLQTDPSDVIRAYEYLKEVGEVSFIKGKRIGRPIFDYIFTFGMQIYCFLKLGVYLDDINAQPKMFNKNFYVEIRDDAPLDFSLDLYFLLKAKEKYSKIYEIPVHFGNRIHGEAKGGGSIKTKLKLAYRTIKFINFLSNKIMNPK